MTSFKSAVHVGTVCHRAVINCDSFGWILKRIGLSAFGVNPYLSLFQPRQYLALIRHVHNLIFFAI